MKKLLLIAIITLMATNNVNAQDSNWTFNTRAWSTNYWNTLIFNGVSGVVKHFVFNGDDNDSLWAERIIPDADMVYPVGIEKKGFGEPNDVFGSDNRIFGPYHRAFAAPFKHMGDYAIGADVSYMPAPIGVYVGAYFKSQEVVWRGTNQSIRAFYFQPRAGLIVGSKTNSFEAGVYYDALTGCGGNLMGKDQDMLKDGLGLDFAFARTDKSGKSKMLIQFMLPLHNFFNEDFQGGALKGIKRRVGYIMLTQRVTL